jgi:hypothetical protein
VNSEELERSLRDEFDTYLKGVVAGLKQETNDFQQRIASEFDRQRQAIDEAFAAFSSRFDSENVFDEAFTSTVGEHLRLARDEGAKITATAFAEAEALEQERREQEEPPPPQKAASYDAIRDAVADISAKDSQSSILKSLVTHAAEFAPRGAFFIIKNEHLAGWKVFGRADEHADSAVRDIHFPISKDTVLSSAINSAQTVESSGGAHTSDSEFLDPLGFGSPDHMYAVPLIARGRAVAVLYADNGGGGGDLSREALETLVRVAGLTVELHAAAATVPAVQGQPAEDLRPTAEYEAPVSVYEEETESHVEEPVRDFSFNESVSYEGGFPQAESGYHEAAPEYSTEPAEEQPYEEGASEEPATFETPGSVEPAGFPEAHDAPFEQPADLALNADFGHTEEAKPQFETGSQFDSVPDFETNSSFEPAQEFEPAPATPFAAFEPAVTAPSIATPEKSVVAIPGSRLSDRNVDLPIEVPEEERRSHNDARRFARLLVSEIKLYNEKKVLEGREHRDLYDRLREAIDRSREMYDKRVQPPVAARFDYFHYELVNSLAEGETGRLGSSYPGPTVS